MKINDKRYGEVNVDAKTNGRRSTDRAETAGRGYQMWGWILFTVCAVFYIVSSSLNGDVLTLIGSVLFLIACFLFMMPMVAALRRRK